MDVHADLAVCVDLPGRLAAEVAAFAESEAGWHVVAADSPLAPALTLSEQVTPGRPTVVVTRDAPEATLLRDAMVAGAIDVIAWPAERERLLSVPHRLPREGSAPAAAVPLLSVVGCRGGVGTSTVALAIAATVAWAGGRALCVGADGMVGLAGLAPWTGPGAADVAALGRHAAGEVAAVAREVPGVPGLHVLGGAAGPVSASGWPYDLVVTDVGAQDGRRPSVMVAAADATVSEATGAGIVLVVEHGPLERAAVKAKLGRAPDGWLPYSRRVARAGSCGRVPSALPGSWVAALQRALSGARR